MVHEHRHGKIEITEPLSHVQGASGGCRPQGRQDIDGTRATILCASESDHRMKGPVIGLYSSLDLGADILLLHHANKRQ